MIARGYKPHKLSKRFYDAAKISKVISFLPEFNRLLPNLNKLIRNRSRLFCSDPKMTIAFHKNEFTKEVRTWNKFCPFLHFHRKNLIVVPSLAVMRCDECTNFIVFNNTFKCTATGKCYQLSATKLVELYLVIFLEYRASESKFDNIKIQLIESMNVARNLL